jgi:hypothetical protein
MAQTPLLRRLSFLDRYLTLRIFSPWRRRIGIGAIFPGVKAVFDRMSIGMTSIPIAIRADPDVHLGGRGAAFNLPGRGPWQQRSHIYQLPGCSSYDTISEQNRVEFPSAQAAEAAGYRSPQLSIAITTCRHPEGRTREQNALSISPTFVSSKSLGKH